MLFYALRCSLTNWQFDETMRMRAIVLVQAAGRRLLARRRVIRARYNRWLEDRWSLKEVFDLYATLPSNRSQEAHEVETLKKGVATETEEPEREASHERHARLVLQGQHEIMLLVERSVCKEARPSFAKQLAARPRTINFGAFIVFLRDTRLLDQGFANSDHPHRAAAAVFRAGADFEGLPRDDDATEQQRRAARSRRKSQSKGKAETRGAAAVGRGEKPRPDSNAATPTGGAGDGEDAAGAAAQSATESSEAAGTEETDGGAAEEDDSDGVASLQPNVSHAKEPIWKLEIGFKGFKHAITEMARQWSRGVLGDGRAVAAAATSVAPSLKDKSAALFGKIDGGRNTRAAGLGFGRLQASMMRLRFLLHFNIWRMMERRFEANGGDPDILESRYARQLVTDERERRRKEEEARQKALEEAEAGGYYGSRKSVPGVRFVSRGRGTSRAAMRGKFVVNEKGHVRYVRLDEIAEREHQARAEAAKREEEAEAVRVKELAASKAAVGGAMLPPGDGSKLQPASTMRDTHGEGAGMPAAARHRRAHGPGGDQDFTRWLSDSRVVAVLVRYEPHYRRLYKHYATPVDSGLKLRTFARLFASADSPGEDPTRDRVAFADFFRCMYEVGLLPSDKLTVANKTDTMALCTAIFLGAENLRDLGRDEPSSGTVDRLLPRSVLARQFRKAFDKTAVKGKMPSASVHQVLESEGGYRIEESEVRLVLWWRRGRKNLLLDFDGFIDVAQEVLVLHWRLSTFSCNFVQFCHALSLCAVHGLINLDVLNRRTGTRKRFQGMQRNVRAMLRATSEEGDKGPPDIELPYFVEYLGQLCQRCFDMMALLAEPDTASRQGRHMTHKMFLAAVAQSHLTRVVPIEDVARVFGRCIPDGHDKATAAEFRQAVEDVLLEDFRAAGFFAQKWVDTAAVGPEWQQPPTLPEHLRREIMAVRLDAETQRLVDAQRAERLREPTEEEARDEKKLASFHAMFGVRKKKKTGPDLRTPVPGCGISPRAAALRTAIYRLHYSFIGDGSQQLAALMRAVEASYPVPPDKAALRRVHSAKAEIAADLGEQVSSNIYESGKPVSPRAVLMALRVKADKAKAAEDARIQERIKAQQQRLQALPAMERRAMQVELQARELRRQERQSRRHESRPATPQSQASARPPSSGGAALRSGTPSSAARPQRSQRSVDRPGQSRRELTRRAAAPSPVRRSTDSNAAGNGSDRSVSRTGTATSRSGAVTSPPRRREQGAAPPSQSQSKSPRPSPSPSPTQRRRGRQRTPPPPKVVPGLATSPVRRRRDAMERLQRDRVKAKAILKEAETSLGQPATVAYDIRKRSAELQQQAVSRAAEDARNPAIAVSPRTATEHWFRAERLPWATQQQLVEANAALGKATSTFLPTNDDFTVVDQVSTGLTGEFVRPPSGTDEGGGQTTTSSTSAASSQAIRQVTFEPAPPQSTSAASPRAATATAHALRPARGLARTMTVATGRSAPGTAQGALAGGRADAAAATGRRDGHQQLGSQAASFHPGAMGAATDKERAAAAAARKEDVALRAYAREHADWSWAVRHDPALAAQRPSKPLRSTATAPLEEGGNPADAARFATGSGVSAALRLLQPEHSDGSSESGSDSDGSTSSDESSVVSATGIGDLDGGFTIDLASTRPTEPATSKAARSDAGRSETTGTPRLGGRRASNLSFVSHASGSGVSDHNRSFVSSRRQAEFEAAQRRQEQAAARKADSQRRAKARAKLLAKKDDLAESLIDSLTERQLSSPRQRGGDMEREAPLGVAPVDGKQHLYYARALVMLPDNSMVQYSHKKYLEEAEAQRKWFASVERARSRPDSTAVDKEEVQALQEGIDPQSPGLAARTLLQSGDKTATAGPSDAAGQAAVPWEKRCQEFTRGGGILVSSSLALAAAPLRLYTHSTSLTLNACATTTECSGVHSLRCHLCQRRRRSARRSARAVDVGAGGRRRRRRLRRQRDSTSASWWIRCSSSLFRGAPLHRAPPWTTTHKGHPCSRARALRPRLSRPSPPRAGSCPALTCATCHLGRRGTRQLPPRAARSRHSGPARTAARRLPQPPRRRPTCWAA